MTQEADCAVELARTRCALRVVTEASHDLVDLVSAIEVPEARRIELDTKLATLRRKLETAADLRSHDGAENAPGE